MLYKIITVGDGAVGKTSLRMRFLGRGFSSEYFSTIGADFSTKDVEIDGNYYGTMQVWDLAGQSRFSYVRSTFYRGTNGVLLVFDVTRKDTFENIKAWMNEILTHTQNASVILVGNKIDLAESREVTPEMGEELAKELGVPYIETSALTGENVVDAFTKLTQLIRDQFTTQLSKEEFLDHKRKAGIFNLEELPTKITEAEKLNKNNKPFEAAEIYRRIADTYRLERESSSRQATDPMISNALKYYQLSAETYVKAQKYTEAAWSYDHLKSLQETIGDYKESLKSYILSAEKYEEAGNLSGAAWRFYDIASQFESDFEFEEAHNYYSKSWEAYLGGKEFSLILESVQKLSLFYERQNEHSKISELWLRSINEAIKSKNYFWAGQLREFYLSLYCPPENKDAEHEKVIDHYLQAAKKFANEKNQSLEARSLLLAAKNATILKKTKDAKKYYEQTLNYYIDSKIWHQAARISIMLGKHEDAVKYYKKEVEENKNSFYEPYLYIARGEYHVISKEHNKATDNFKSALNTIRKITKGQIPSWQQDELIYLEKWVEGRIAFQEGVKFSEIDNHSKAQKMYSLAVEKFEEGITKDLADERRNLLKGFISLSNGLNAFEEMQKLEEQGDSESAKKRRRMFNFNLSRANANFTKAGQFNISRLITAILEAVEEDEFARVKTTARDIFPSFEPVSTQKLSKLGLANAYLKCSIKEVKPLQVEVNESCALSVHVGIDEKFFKETQENWLSLFMTCSDSIVSPISIPLTLTEQMTEFSHIFTPKFVDSGETTIKIQVKDLEQTMDLKSLVSDPIKVIKQYIPLEIILIVETEEDEIFTSGHLAGPVTQKIDRVKSKVKTTKLLRLAGQIEHIAGGQNVQENFKKLGKGIYDAIIPETVRKELHKAIEFALSQNVPINFMINASRNLMAVPFELFYSDDPNIDGFLAAKFSLFRYPVEKKLMPIEKLTPRISKVLLISANPLGGNMDLPNVDRENEEIHELLTKIGIQAKMITSKNSTLQNVLEELLVNEYEAIHFSGHGIFDPKNPMESGLMLGLKGKSPEYLTALNIKELLGETKLKLIFLNSCYSATQSTELSTDEVLGISDAFIQVGVPTIIGMQWPVTDKGALILSENFYKQVFQKNVDFPTALKFSRLQLRNQRPQDPSWACPMLVKHPSL